jgi:hypothetical protein
MRDGFLPIQTAEKTDNTKWYCFWLTMKAFNAEPEERQPVAFNMLWKANISFSGVKWCETPLLWGQKTRYRKILPKDDLHDNKQRKRGRHPPKVGNYIIWKPVDEKPRLQDTSKLYSVVKQRKTEQGEH